MIFRKFSTLRIKLSILKSYYSIRIFLGILRRCPPFKYFFYTLVYFEIDEIYKKNLKIHRQKSTKLTREIINDIRAKSEKEYEEIQGYKAEKEKNRIELTEAYIALAKLKIDELNRFLIQNLEDNKIIIKYSNRALSIFNPKNSKDSYEKLCQFVDSVIEEYNQTKKEDENV